MRKTGLFLIDFILMGIMITSCVKEEDDFIKPYTADKTVIAGNTITSDGEAIPGIKLKVDYVEGAWLQYSKTRHKAHVQSGKDGSYKMEFYVKDDEIEPASYEPDNKNQDYQFIVDLSSLDPQQYILPKDMISQIDASGNVTEADVPATYICLIHPKRDTAYIDNIYIPKKKYINVTLKGLNPQLIGSYFEATTYFPWGTECEKHNKLIDTKYNICSSGTDLYVAKTEEQTFKMPFALNENNVMIISKLKNGVATRDTCKVYVTKDSPQSLTFEY